MGSRVLQQCWAAKQPLPFITRLINSVQVHYGTGNFLYQEFICDSKRTEKFCASKQFCSVGASISPENESAKVCANCKAYGHGCCVYSFQGYQKNDQKQVCVTICKTCIGSFTDFVNFKDEIEKRLNQIIVTNTPLPASNFGNAQGALRLVVEKMIVSISIYAGEVQKAISDEYRASASTLPVKAYTACGSSTVTDSTGNLLISASSISVGSIPNAAASLPVENTAKSLPIASDSAGVMLNTSSDDTNDLTLVKSALPGPLYSTPFSPAILSVKKAIGTVAHMEKLAEAAVTNSTPASSSIKAVDTNQNTEPLDEYSLACLLSSTPNAAASSTAKEAPEKVTRVEKSLQENALPCSLPSKLFAAASSDSPVKEAPEIVGPMEEVVKEAEKQLIAADSAAMMSQSSSDQTQTESLDASGIATLLNAANSPVEEAADPEASTSPVEITAGLNPFVAVGPTSPLPFYAASSELHSSTASGSGSIVAKVVSDCRVLDSRIRKGEWEYFVREKDYNDEWLVLNPDDQVLCDAISLYLENESVKEDMKRSTESKSKKKEKVSSFQREKELVRRVSQRRKDQLENQPLGISQRDIQNLASDSSISSDEPEEKPEEKKVAPKRKKESERSNSSDEPEKKKATTRQKKEDLKTVTFELPGEKKVASKRKAEIQITYSRLGSRSFFLVHFEKLVSRIIDPLSEHDYFCTNLSNRYSPFPVASFGYKNNLQMFAASHMDIYQPCEAVWGEDIMFAPVAVETKAAIRGQNVKAIKEADWRFSIGFGQRFTYSDDDPLWYYVVGFTYNDSSKHALVYVHIEDEEKLLAALGEEKGGIQFNELKEYPLRRFATNQIMSLHVPKSTETILDATNTELKEGFFKSVRRLFAKGGELPTDYYFDPKTIADIKRVAKQWYESQLTLYSRPQTKTVNRKPEASKPSSNPVQSIPTTQPLQVNTLQSSSFEKQDEEMDVVQNPLNPLSRLQEELLAAKELKETQIAQVKSQVKTLELTRKQKVTLLRPLSQDMSDLEKKLFKVQKEIKEQAERNRAEYLSGLKSQSEQQAAVLTRVVESQAEQNLSLTAEFGGHLNRVADSYKEVAKQQSIDMLNAQRVTLDVIKSEHKAERERSAADRAAYDKNVQVQLAAGKEERSELMELLLVQSKQAEQDRERTAVICDTLQTTLVEVVKESKRSRKFLKRLKNKKEPKPQNYIEDGNWRRENMVPYLGERQIQMIPGGIGGSGQYTVSPAGLQVSAHQNFPYNPSYGPSAGGFQMPPLSFNPSYGPSTAGLQMQPPFILGGFSSSNQTPTPQFHTHYAQSGTPQEVYVQGTPCPVESLPHPLLPKYGQEGDGVSSSSGSITPERRQTPIPTAGSWSSETLNERRPVGAMLNMSQAQMSQLQREHPDWFKSASRR